MNSKLQMQSLAKLIAKMLQEQKLLLDLDNLLKMVKLKRQMLKLMIIEL